MRIEWSQGGLHLLPESDVETEAMLVLLDGLKVEGLRRDDSPCNEPRAAVGSDRLGDVKRGLDLDF